MKLQMKPAIYGAAFGVTIITALVVKERGDDYYKQCMNSPMVPGLTVSQEEYCSCQADKMPSRVKAVSSNMIDLIQKNGSTREILNETERAKVLQEAEMEAGFMCAVANS
jgi:hypothetical protein